MEPRLKGSYLYLMRPSDLFIPLDRDCGKSLQDQVFDALRQMVLAGRLAPDTRLPASRALSVNLAVGRNTIIAAYERLAAEGYVVTASGGGTRIAKLTPEHVMDVGGKDAAHGHESSSAFATSPRGRDLLVTRGDLPMAERPAAFSPGHPAIDVFPKMLWGRLMAEAIRSSHADDLNYGHVAGWPDLRTAIAAQVQAARGVVAEPDQVIITTGTQAGLVLAVQLLTQAGDDVWLEDPGYLGARAAFAGAGCRINAVPVDDQGLNIDAGLELSRNPKLIYVTPSHQFPKGVTLSLARRLRLVDEPALGDAVILEDDYDSEFRFSGRPLSSLQGLAVDRQGNGARVIYLGTFAKTLFPALRIGFLVVPKGLIDVFTRGVRAMGLAPPIQTQMALTRFIADGHYASHIRRMRLIYQRRQAITLDAIRTYFGPAAPGIIPDGGMQLPLRLDLPQGDMWLKAAGEQAGLSLSPLSRLSLSGDGWIGLHLGYGAVADHDIAPQIKRLSALVEHGHAS
jgi:GntR family transcriptional regulator/MocR family aminotransferase